MNFANLKSKRAREQDFRDQLEGQHNKTHKADTGTHLVIGQEETNTKPETPKASSLPYIVGVVCLIIGVLCVTAEVLTNTHTYAKLTDTVEDKGVFGLIGLIPALGAIVLLTVSYILWRYNRLASLVAFLMWVCLAPVSVIPTGTFVSERIGDHHAKRGASLDQSTDLKLQRGLSISITKLAYETQVRKREMECKNGEGTRCKLEMANELEALKTYSTSNAVPTVSSATIGTADPLSFIGEWRDTARQIQFWGLTISPALAGLFFFFATALFRVKNYLSNL